MTFKITKPSPTGIVTSKKPCKSSSPLIFLPQSNCNIPRGAGISGYQQAVRDGFKGSEYEWITGLIIKSIEDTSVIYISDDDKYIQFSFRDDVYLNEDSDSVTIDLPIGE